MVLLRIKGPICIWRAREDIDFNVISEFTNQTIGKISKQWTDVLQGMFTVAHNFGISFLIDLDVHVKALLIGAAMLIDFIYYEGKHLELRIP